MLSRRVIGMLLLLVIMLTSCMTEKSTSYELAYLVTGDSLKVVDKDSLKYETDSINLIVEGKPEKIESNVLNVLTSVTTTDEEPKRAVTRYRMLSKQNKVLADFLIVDNESNGSFDSFSATGDISLISQKIGESWAIIRNTVNEDINSLHQTGKKKIVDASTGKEIKEEKGKKD